MAAGDGHRGLERRHVVLHTVALGAEVAHAKHLAQLVSSAIQDISVGMRLPAHLLRGCYELLQIN